MKHRKSCLAALLAACLLLELLPARAAAADSAIRQRTATLDLTGEVTYATIGGGSATADAQNTNITDSAEGWRWDYAARTLTLSGADIQGTAVGSETAGVILPDGACIQLTADTENAVKAADSADTASTGVLGRGTLTITGDGSLTAAAGAGKSSYGIYGRAGVTVSGNAQVNATGGAATDPSGGSFGIYVRKTGDAVFSDSCRVIATAGTSYTRSHGIYAYDPQSVRISGNADVTAKGGQVTDQTDFGTHIQGSSGICAYQDVMISGGTVRAQGGTADGGYAASYGIRASVGDVSIQGAASVDASGGTAFHESDGISAGKAFSASGSGTVVHAAAGRAAGSIGVFAGDGVHVDDAHVTAAGAEASGYSRGLYCFMGNVEFSGAAQVKATGGRATVRSDGILAFSNDMALSGEARVDSTGGPAASSSGICVGVNGITARFSMTDNAQLTATGGEASGSTGTIAENSSFGAYIMGPMEVLGDTILTAKGGAASAGGSYGICSNYNNPDTPSAVTLSSGGTVTAAGAAAAQGESCGIYGTAVEITNGTILAGGDTTNSRSGYGIRMFGLVPTISISGGSTKAWGKTGGVSDLPILTDLILLGKRAADRAMEFVTGESAGFVEIETRPAVSGLALSPVSITVARGKTQQFTAKTAFQSGEPVDSANLVS